MLCARIKPEFESWRNTARNLLLEGVAPEQIVWSGQDDSAEFLPTMFQPVQAVEVAAENAPRIPAVFMSAARAVSLHRDQNRWGLLYRLLYRLTHGEPNLLKITVDDDVVQLFPWKNKCGGTFTKCTPSYDFGS